MPFALQAVLEDEITSLHDGAPFSLLSARGLAGPAIQRATAQGPAQDGDTDHGYKLSPRQIELEIGIQANNASELDGYRDTLLNLFRPRSDTPLKLRLTRDDGDVRQLDVYTVDAVQVDMLVSYRPGFHQRAKVRLYAPDPAYYDPTPGTVTLTGSATISADWYLAGGAIGTARVLMSGSVPGAAEAWSYTGTIAATESYTLAFRTAMEDWPDISEGGKQHIVFWVGTAGLTTTARPLNFSVDYLGYFTLGTAFDATAPRWGSVFPAGTMNLFTEYNYNGLHGDPAQRFALSYIHPSTQALVVTAPSRGADSTVPITAANRYWNGLPAQGTQGAWEHPIDRYALYSPALNEAEIHALSPYMAGNIGGTIASYTFIPLEGNMRIYPEITITGPINEPTVMTVVDNHLYQLQFAGYNLGAGTTVVFDLTPGVKTVLEGGSVDVREYLSSFSTLNSFHLFPDPDTGGNQIALFGTNIGTATQLQVVYKHRFASF